MYKQNNILKYLIPVIAVIVVIESIVLVSNLSQRSAGNTINTNNKVTQGTGVENNNKVSATPSGPSIYDLVFATTTQEMKTGKSYKVELSALSKDKHALDSIFIYIKFDPKLVDINGLTADQKLPKPAFMKVSQEKGIAVVNYLISEPGGLVVNGNQNMPLVAFTVKPKVVGKFDLEISTGNDSKESATMFVENGSGKALPYSSNKLTVNVTK